MSENQKMGCIGPILGGATICALIFNWFGIRTFADNATANLLQGHSAKTSSLGSPSGSTSLPAKKRIDESLVGSWEQNASNPMWSIALGAQGAGWYLVYVREGGNVVTERGASWYVEGGSIVCDGHTGVKTVKPPRGLEWSEPVDGQRYRFGYEHTGTGLVRIQDGKGNPIDLRQSR
jgi:hypothetical protein